MTIFELQLFWITIAPTYYGLMYAIWFMAWYQIIKNRWVIPFERMDNLFMYIFLWVVLWWRFGYVLFYNFSSYLSNPLEILKFWEWWMSFHWWVLWVLLAMYLFSKRYKINFLVLADQITLILPIWIWLWRVGNYLNKELLWYSPYNWLLAIEKNGVWYFPSPLLEAFLEWVVLYFVLLFFYKKMIKWNTSFNNTFNDNYHRWQIWALFLVFYAIFRLFVEMFFRMPDSHIWYIMWYFTMWEILTLPMLIIWIILYFRFKNNLWKTD